MFKQFRDGYYLIFSSLTIAVILTHCETTQHTQCEQIFNIARRVIDTAEFTISTAEGEPIETEKWLPIAQKIDTASQELEALTLEDTQLIKYRNNLTKVYQIYAAAIVDAVKARQKQDLAALKAARDRAYDAGKLQREAIAEINAYCIDN